MNEEQNSKCIGKIDCIRAIQREKRKELLHSMVCINAGVIGTSAGIFLTMTRRTPLALTIGTSLLGASSSLLIAPIQNSFNGDRFSWRRTLDSAAACACESALIAPLGMLMRLTRLKSIEHMSIGASTGVTYNFVETNFYASNPTTSVAAIMGVIGGISTHIMNLFCQMLSNEKIFRAFRIGLEIFIVMLIDCGIGIYGHDQFWANFFSQITMIFVSEFGMSLTRRTGVFNKAVNLDLIRGNFCKDKIANTHKFEAQLMDISTQINSLPQTVINENVQRVKTFNDLKQKLAELKYNKRIFKQNNSSVSAKGQKQQQQQSYNLPVTANEIKRLEKIAASMRPRLMGENNMHFLIGSRSGQVAVDLTPRDMKSGRRGAQRVIFEEYCGKFIYTDHTLHHNYNECRKSSRSLVIDSSEVMLVNRIFVKNNYCSDE